MGVLQAGFKIKVCVELDKYCCETLRKNFSAGTKIFEGDIRQLNPKNLDVGQIDLLFGDSPCQAFSQAGKKLSLEDKRGELIFEFIKFARELKPLAILIEQVKGFLTAKDLSGKSGGVFQSFVNRLERLGYVVKWQVLSAVDYGVPQKRERVFLVALMNDNFNFPTPTHAEQEDLFCLPYKTVGDVIKKFAAELGKSH